MRIRVVLVAVVVVSGLLPPGDLFGTSPARAQTTELCDTSSGVTQFTDVEAADYAAAYVLCMRALGLSKGAGDGTEYRPDRNINRGQMASFLVRLWRDTLDKTCPEGSESPFTDTPAGGTHTAAINCLYNLGITQGTSATTYGPAEPLKASHISRFLLRTYLKAGATCPTTTGEGELGRAVDCLQALRVIPTTAEGRSPDPVNRAQMAVYVIGLWHNLDGHGLPPTPPTKPTTQPPATTTTMPPSATPQQRIAYGRWGDGLWVVNADGANPKRLTNNVSYWAWSPDGTRVIYDVRDSDSRWVVDADGANPKQIANNVSDWAWSPDGTRVMYRVLDLETGTARYSLWVVDADGANPKQISTDDTRSGMWSPDGTRIIYDVDVRDSKARRTSLWVVDADGTNPKKITDAVGARSGAWSPDGTRVMYRVLDLEAGTARYSLWVVDADGTNPKKVTDDYGWRGSTLSGKWSPDGTRIIYQVAVYDREAGTSGYSLWVVNADGTRRKQLTDNLPTLDRWWWWQWSPDGTRVTYAVRGDGETGRSLWVANADGTNPKQLTDNRPDWRGSWEWSPDGTRISYEVYDSQSDTFYNLWVANGDGTSRKQLTDNRAEWKWSPDGTRITYAVADPKGSGPWREGRSLWVANADGTNPRQLTNNVSGWEWSRDGARITYTVSHGDGETPRFSLWVASGDGTSPKQIIDDVQQNWEWLSDGTGIMYEVYDWGTQVGSLWVVNADGTNPKQISNDITNWSPIWALSPDGTGRTRYNMFHDPAKRDIPDDTV